jgi:hypothetical protein
MGQSSPGSGNVADTEMALAGESASMCSRERMRSVPENSVTMYLDIPVTSWKRPPCCGPSIVAVMRRGTGGSNGPINSPASETINGSSNGSAPKTFHSETSVYLQQRGQHNSSRVSPPHMVMADEGQPCQPQVLHSYSVGSTSGSNSRFSVSDSSYS